MKRLSFLSFNALFICIFSLLTLNHAQAAYFQGLGDLPGGDFSSGAWGVSDDGTTVAGNSVSDLGGEPFLWTQSTGMISLGDLPDYWSSTSCGTHCVSGDGSTVVGDGHTASGGTEAFRWTQSTGFVGLGHLPCNSPNSSAYDTSYDGSVVVGRSCTTPGGTEAFRWTQSDGMIGLGDLPGGSFYSLARGVSNDGSKVVGDSESGFGVEAFLWTQGDGMIGLGQLSGGSTFFSSARAVSADGLTVVGQSSSPFGDQAFRWTQSTGMVGLGDLPGGSFHSYARDVSSDGSIVVGRSNSQNYINEAFIWDNTNGMRSLKEVLELVYGLDLTGWILEDAIAISADGSTIVGYGYNPDGNIEAWIAKIDTVPINLPPISNSGADQAVFDEVTLDGRSSFDPDGSIVSYLWILQHRTNSANDRDASGVNPIVSNLRPGFYDVHLSVTDDGGLVSVDNMLLAVAGSCSTSPFPDEDEDGEPDLSDLCPDTPLDTDIDSEGCSLLQFCSGIDTSEDHGRKICDQSDWKNDEPLENKGDCKAVKQGKGPSNYSCVPR